jgi:DNA-binding transcriptional LysR family regulator
MQQQPFHDDDPVALLNRVELKHLRCFVAVADELHFGRAALRLGLSQQHVSDVIAAIEESLEVKLFERTTRRVTLTPAGQTLLPAADKILADVGMALRLTRRVGNNSNRRLRVAFSGYAVESLLPDIFREFKRIDPTTILELHEHHTTRLVDDLESGTIDADFALQMQLTKPSLRVDVLREDGFALMVPSNVYSAMSAKHKLADYSTFPFVRVALSIGPTLAARTDALFQEAGFEPEIAHEAGDVQTILGLVAAGVGVCIVPAFVATLRRRGVGYIPLRSKERVALALTTRAGDNSQIVESLRSIACSMSLRTSRP